MRTSPAPDSPGNCVICVTTVIREANRCKATHLGAGAMTQTKVSMTQTPEPVTQKVHDRSCGMTQMTLMTQISEPPSGWQTNSTIPVQRLVQKKQDPPLRLWFPIQPPNGPTAPLARLHSGSWQQRR